MDRTARTARSAAGRYSRQEFRDREGAWLAERGKRIRRRTAVLAAAVLAGVRSEAPAPAAARTA